MAGQRPESPETTKAKDVNKRGSTSSKGKSAGRVVPDRQKSAKEGKDDAVSVEESANTDFAIVQYGKHQFYLAEGMKIDLPRINVEEGKEFVFDKVLAFSKNGEFKLGTPYVKGAYVRVFVIKHGRGPKKYGFKYKAKSRYRRRWGYRNLFTRVRVVEVG